MKLTLENMHMYCTEVGECMLWNLGCNGSGYPQAYIEGKPAVMVRRHVFTSLMGKTLRRKDRVTARCGNPICISPLCLKAETWSEGMRRAYTNGSRIAALEYQQRLNTSQGIGIAKLTWDQVNQIRAEPLERTHQSIAEEYGMSHKAISKIRRGITWRTKALASDVFAWAQSR